MLKTPAKKVPKKPAAKKERTVKPAVQESPATTVATPPSPMPEVKLVLDQTQPPIMAPTATSYASSVPLSGSPAAQPPFPPEVAVPTPLTTEMSPEPTSETPIIASTIPTEAASGTSSQDDFEPESKGGGLRLVLIFITALLVGGGAVAGFFYYSKQKSAPTPTVMEPTAAPSVVPKDTTATDSAETTDLSVIAVQILNGSGKAGEAAKVRDLLQAGGFKTFTLSNADSYDYTDTEVQLKPGTPQSVFEAVEKSLANYTVVEKEELGVDNDFDVVITVGQSK